MHFFGRRFSEYDLARSMGDAPKRQLLFDSLGSLWLCMIDDFNFLLVWLLSLRQLDSALYFNVSAACVVAC